MSLDVDLYVMVDSGATEPMRVELFDANYTHNCNKMAEAAGIYQCVWRPEECDPPINLARQLIEPLRAGIKQMEDDPAKFIDLNPANGWGSYETFLPWLREYLQACIEHPKAQVRACR